MFITEIARMKADTAFEPRAWAAGLRVGADDMPKLEALVKDMDRAAATLRGPRDYGEEPLSAFRLRPAGKN
jgi:hypothetical protein